MLSSACRSFSGPEAGLGVLMPAAYSTMKRMEAGSRMGKILFGIVLGLALAPLAVLGWFHWGHPPVAVADPPLPFERQITHVPLNVRIQREMPNAPFIETSEANFVAGAEIYRDHCAACHGFYGKPSAFAAHMYPECSATLAKTPEWRSSRRERRPAGRNLLEGRTTAFGSRACRRFTTCFQPRRSGR